MLADIVESFVYAQSKLPVAVLSRVYYADYTKPSLLKLSESIESLVHISKQNDIQNYKQELQLIEIQLHCVVRTIQTVLMYDYNAEEKCIDGIRLLNNALDRLGLFFGTL
jgi:hypothetical protein